MNAQELEDVISDMETEQKRIEKQYQHFSNLISETPDTRSTGGNKKTRHMKRLEGENHPNIAPTSQKLIMSVRPKNQINYPDPTFYKQSAKTKEWTHILDFSTCQNTPQHHQDKWKKKRK